MKKFLPSLIILSFSLLLFGVTYGADCSNYANQVSQIRLQLKDAQSMLDALNSDLPDDKAYLGGLSSSAMAGIMAPLAKQQENEVQQLKGLLALAEQNYNACLNNEKNSREQEFLDKIIDYLEEGESYFKLGKKYLEEKNFKDAQINFIKSYSVYKAFYDKYNEESNFTDFVDEHFDMESYLIGNFVAIGVNLCSFGDRINGPTVLINAVNMGSTDAKGVYDICNNMTKQESDDLWCSSKYGENYVGNRDEDGVLHCRCPNKFIEIDGVCRIGTQDEVNNKCINKYGPNSLGFNNNGVWSCGCENGYIKDTKGLCVLSGNSSKTNNTSIDNKPVIYNNGYSQEFNESYQFAFENKITTMPTIEQASMYGEIIRAEIAKMLANWVKSTGRTPDTSKFCNFKDISGVQGDLSIAIIESCQLGIMGQGIDEFRPFDKITKGEVATAISRIIWGNKNDGGEPFYLKHMDALRNIGVLDDILNPGINELRGNVMVMLMKASNSDEIKN